jgi:site-specific recombinase XerD
VFGNSIPFKESTILFRKNKYCDLTDSKKRIRVHDFRHSCASLLIKNGASIALVSKYLGHAKISITLNTYTHMYKSELENITNLINKL